MKQNFNKITALILAVTVLALAGCAQGPDQTREDQVSGFNRVTIETFGEVLIEQGSEESLTIEAPRDYLRYITSEVKDGTLFIKTRRGFVGGPVQHVTYNLTVKDLEEVTFSGAGSIKIFSLETGDFKVNLTGAGSIEIDDLMADTLLVNLTSAGAVVIAGNAVSQEVNLSGVGSYEAGDLLSKEAKVQLTGAGSAVIWAEKTLDVNISGIGSVSYFGDPEVSQNISGLGSVNSKGKH
jgi:hypothetical protein